jgi:putative redox protein
MKQIHASVTETGASPFAVTIEVSGHRLTGDEPVDEGGGGLGPSPFDLLTAALAECTAMTVRWYARQQGWPLERVEVDVRHEKGGAGTSSARQDRFEKEIRLFGANLDDVQRAKLIEIAAKCPVQRSLEGTPLILTRAG